MCSQLRQHREADLLTSAGRPAAASAGTWQHAGDRPPSSAAAVPAQQGACTPAAAASMANTHAKLFWCCRRQSWTGALLRAFCTLSAALCSRPHSGARPAGGAGMQAWTLTWSCRQLSAWQLSSEQGELEVASVLMGLARALLTIARTNAGIRSFDTIGSLSRP